jgi:hypothetical protein
VVAKVGENVGASVGVDLGVECQDPIVLVVYRIFKNEKGDRRDSRVLYESQRHENENKHNHTNAQNQIVWACLCVGDANSLVISHRPPVSASSDQNVMRYPELLLGPIRAKRLCPHNKAHTQIQSGAKQHYRLDFTGFTGFYMYERFHA